MHAGDQRTSQGHDPVDGLSGFEIARELRCDLRWKATYELGLYDTGFDPSLLSCFRRFSRAPAAPGCARLTPERISTRG